MTKTYFHLFSLCAICIVLLDVCKTPDPPTPKCTQPAPPQASHNGPVGIGDTLKLSVETIPGATYTWSGPSKFKSNSQYPFLIYNNNYAGEFTVTATIDGCTSEPFHIYVNSLKNHASSNSPVKWKATLALKASPVFDFYGNVVPATYSWTGPNTFTATVPNPTISNVSMQAAGTYSVTTTTAMGSFTSTTEVFIQPDSLAKNQVTSNSPQPVGSTLSFSVQAVEGATAYIWKGPNGFNYTSQDSSISIQKVSRKSMGVYTVQYVVNNITSLPKTINVFISYSENGCGVDTSVMHNGNTYKITQIGNQCWTAENLKKASNQRTYFLWNQIIPIETDTQGVCPLGWHLPSLKEWQSLASSVNYDADALKSSGSNTSGFSASLSMKNGIASYWSVTGASNEASFMQLSKNDNLIRYDITSKTDSMFVRCIKD